MSDVVEQPNHLEFESYINNYTGKVIYIYTHFFFILRVHSYYYHKLKRTKLTNQTKTTFLLYRTYCN